MGSQQRFLMHHGNADGRGFGGTGDADFLIAPQHLARVPLHHSRHNLHERGLACSVFAEKQVHLTGVDRQIAIDKGADAAISLLNVL